MSSIKGKSTRSNLKIAKVDKVDILQLIINDNRKIVLSANTSHVNKLAFFLTTSYDISFMTITYIANGTTSSLIKAIKYPIKLYNKAGFFF